MGGHVPERRQQAHPLGPSRVCPRLPGTIRYERTILWNDPDIGIEWPLDGIRDIVLSEKDSNGVLLKNADIYEDPLQ